MDRRRFLATVSSGAVALAVDPWGLAARAGGVVPTALVTADLESHVVAVDLSTSRVLSRLETAPGPRSIETVLPAVAIVGHTEPGVVSILVSSGGLRLRGELDGFEEPRYAAIHPSRAYAFVTDSAREEIVVVRVRDARVVGRVRVPGPARHVSTSSDGATIWTVLGNSAARVAVLDASDPRRPHLERTFATPFPAHDVVFAPDGRTVWVTSGAERRVAIYARERRPRRVLAAGAPPQHVAFARDRAFVASGDDGTVRRHRLGGELVRMERIPVGSYNVSFDWGTLVTPSLGAGTIALLDRSGRVRAVRKVARAAHDACIVHTL
jgi:DNA-binding beta-propeller fold protein YncE